jgi:16S rRNA C1402 N4-methylase RsmH
MEDIYDKIDNLGKVKLNEVYLDSFLKLLKEAINKGDWVDAEIIHSIEDEIMKKFIKKLSTGKLHHEEIMLISKKIIKINKAMDKIGRWYA